MLNSGVIAFGANGKIRNTAALPKQFNGGTPVTDAGVLGVSTGAPLFFVGGLGYDVAGAVCADPTNPITGYTQGGLPMAGNRLAVDNTAAAIDNYLAGIPFAGGRVAFETIE
jgi:hypothetical protein